MRKQNPWTWVVVSIVGLLIMGGWWFTPLINQHLSVEVGRTDKEVGAVGDIFGSINALFSGLAFLGLIVTIILQKKELHDNTTALNDQKAEFEKQVAVMEKQVNLMALQAQVSAAIEMLPMKREVLDTSVRIINEYRGENMGDWEIPAKVRASELIHLAQITNAIEDMEKWHNNALDVYHRTVEQWAGSKGTYPKYTEHHNNDAYAKRFTSMKDSLILALKDIANLMETIEEGFSEIGRIRKSPLREQRRGAEQSAKQTARVSSAGRWD